MRRISARERGLLVFTLAVLVILALAFFVFLPMRDAGRRLDDQARDLLAKIAEAQRMYREGEAAGAEIARLRAQATEAFMTEKADIMPAVMREVSQLSRDLGLRLTSIKPGEPESVQDCIRYPLTFRVEADLAHIVRLLYEVEQPEHRLWVEGLEIGPGPRGGSDLAATVHTATYAVRSTREAADAKT